MLICLNKSYTFTFSFTYLLGKFHKLCYKFHSNVLKIMLQLSTLFFCYTTFWLQPAVAIILICITTSVRNSLLSIQIICLIAIMQTAPYRFHRLRGHSLFSGYKSPVHLAVVVSFDCLF